MNTLIAKLKTLSKAARAEVRTVPGMPGHDASVARAEALEEALALAKREHAAFRRWTKKRQKELERERKDAGTDPEMLFEYQGKDSMLDEVVDWMRTVR